MSLDGNTSQCLMHEEGLAARLPLGHDPYTIAMWIEPDSTCGTTAWLIGWGHNTWGELVALRFNGGLNVVEDNWYGVNQDNVGTAASRRPHAFASVQPVPAVRGVRGGRASRQARQRQRRRV